MSKYIDIDNATFEWDESSVEEYGDTFEGGLLYALDALSRDTEPCVFEPCVKHMSKRRLKERLKYQIAASENYCERIYELKASCDRLSRHALTLEAKQTTYTANARLLEKLASLYERAADDHTLVCDRIAYDRIVLMDEYGFTEDEVSRFLELVEEMAERRAEHEENSDTL